MWYLVPSQLVNLYTWSRVEKRCFDVMSRRSPRSPRSPGMQVSGDRPQTPAVCHYSMQSKHIPDNWPFWRRQFSRLTSNKLHYSVPHWLTVTQAYLIRVGIDAEFLFVQLKFVWENLKVDMTSACIETITKWKRSIALTKIFIFVYRY